MQKDECPSMIQPKFQNIAAIAYVFILYSSGIFAITLPFWQLNVLGVILIVHSLVISTALTHEFIHGNIFKSRELNAFWGKAMTHVNGACYAPWENIVKHHFNHHLEHVDVVRFDTVKYIKEEVNPVFRWIYIKLEWLYFPLLEFEMRWRIIFEPVLDASKRSLLGRNIGLMIYRTIVFGLLAWISWKALLLYFIAYISFVNCERFIDGFQHTYEYVIIGNEFPKFDRTYEQKNTFSNLFSTKYPWLNLLCLNFGYHNAHHHNMSCPWHELPALHAKLYSESTQNILPLGRLIINYHRFRLSRLLGGQGELDESGALNLAEFAGGVGVSLLTPVSY
jgi:fatty acid desaturase